MDISAMLVNFAKEFPLAMWRLLWILGVVVGMIYVGSSLLKLSRASRLPGQNTVTAGDILPLIVIGALLLNLRIFINTVWNSMASGTVSYGPVAYAQAATFGQLADAINAVLTLASVAGGCYFFKGITLLKKATVEGQSSQGADDTVWRAITHMMGGSLLVQIADTIERFRQTAQITW